ncbi:hypothetical protein BC629DRAFT_1443086 [Irpex lacteus]|nr:hypothetical protein BC629DRAFT_1443086 [Irpex lacteus]
MDDRVEVARRRYETRRARMRHVLKETNVPPTYPSYSAACTTKPPSSPLTTRSIPSTTVVNTHLYQHRTIARRQLPMRPPTDKSPERRELTATSRQGKVRLDLHQIVFDVTHLSDYTGRPRLLSDVDEPQINRVLRLQTTGTTVSHSAFAHRDNGTNAPSAISKPPAQTLSYGLMTIRPLRILAWNTPPAVCRSISVEPPFHPSSSSTLTTVDRNDEDGRKDVSGRVLSLLYKSVYGQVFAVDVDCRSKTVNLVAEDSTMVVVLESEALTDTKRSRQFTGACIAESEQM